MTKEREIVEVVNNSSNRNTESHEKRKCNLSKLEKARKLIGNRFGHLLVIDIIRIPNKSREFYCVCKCDCGNTTRIPKRRLMKQKSCGIKCPFIEKPQKGSNSFSTEKFIELVKSKHGDRYDFSKSRYLNRYTPLVVTCKIHGDFIIKPQTLLTTGMCPKCREETELICGVGISDYVGSEPHRGNKIWEVWSHMIQRCYAEYSHKIRVTYRNVKVCDEWHRYSTFRKWYLENYIEGCDIDKDLLQHGIGNKIYSPDTVVFLPREINCVLITNKRRRGKLPIGVCKHDNTYYAYMNIGHGEDRKSKLLGSSTTSYGAFLLYKNGKESYIKKLADEYFEKGMITEKTKIALYNYQVLEED